MRLYSAITGVFLIAAAALPAAGRADGMPAPAAAAMPAAPQCNCLRPHRVVHHRVWRHARHWRRAAPSAPYLAANYNPLLPSAWDSAYDRAMTLHLRSPAVSGFVVAEPGYPPTPPVAGIAPYRVPAYAGVYQYDLIAGAYVRLAQSDAVRSGVPLPPPPAAPAPAPAPQ